MQVKLAYFGHSRLQAGGNGQVLNLAPNLAHEPVAFDASLVQPLRFREAISALHDVVISDLRYTPRDKTAYQQWKLEEQQRLAHTYRQSYKEAREEVLAHRTDVPKDLEHQYELCRRKYWNARQKYSSYLLKHDWSLWRLLMPCDPITTVADDVVYFECFSADESSYGCLTVDRETMFGASADYRRGTTNVDYSWALYDHFQQLRTYRETRFRLDPQGFEVAVEGNADYREEKIDLPAGWLRGLLQVQAAMTLPMRRVTLSREAVYSLLAWLKRHKAERSPRALRFELTPGEAPRLVVEPWEQAIVASGLRYEGPGGAPIRVWGRQRLLVLARLLPLVERVDVYLLGSGMPSFWVAQMGDMRLTLGLSGWTANDWTRRRRTRLAFAPRRTFAGAGRRRGGRLANPASRAAGRSAPGGGRFARRVRRGAQLFGAHRPGDLRPGGRRLPLAADHADRTGRSRSGSRTAGACHVARFDRPRPGAPRFARGIDGRRRPAHRPERRSGRRITARCRRPHETGQVRLQTFPPRRAASRPLLPPAGAARSIERRGKPTVDAGRLVPPLAAVVGELGVFGFEITGEYIPRGASRPPETSLLRRSAVVELACPCFPKAVVRNGVRTPIAGRHDNPKVSTGNWSSDALVNDLGPRHEVSRSAAPSGLLQQ